MDGVGGGRWRGVLRLAGNVMRSGSTLEIKEAILHLMPKKNGCPVSLDPWSECSQLLLFLMNGRCFMCLCCEVAVEDRCIHFFVLQKSEQELT